MEISNAATASGVAFLDGTHFVHSTRMAAVKSALADFKQPVTHLSISFTFPIGISDPGAIRANPKLEPGGALCDLGWFVRPTFPSLSCFPPSAERCLTYMSLLFPIGAYLSCSRYCCRAAVAILGAEAAVVSRAQCVGSVGRYGVLEKAAGSVEMIGGQTFTFDCGFNGPCRQRIEAVTSVGAVEVPDFVLPIGNSGPFDYVRPAENGTAELGFAVETSCKVGADGSVAIAWPERRQVAVEEECKPQAAAMLKAFWHLVQGGSDERSRWMKETLATQRILDACLADAVNEQ